LPSRSNNSAPFALATKNGSPPTLFHDLTGELTPPGNNPEASLNAAADRLSTFGGLRSGFNGLFPVYISQIKIHFGNKVVNLTQCQSHDSEKLISLLKMRTTCSFYRI
jgi:hypothetical protein